ATRDHSERVVTKVNRVEAMARAAEPKHLDALMRFAERAFRRPLRSDEREALLAFYKNLRAQDGLTHEEAIRDTLAGVMMSPNFLYRVDLIADGKAVQPLDDY